MNATDKAEALRLLDDLRAAAINFCEVNSERKAKAFDDAYAAPRSLLSAQEAEPSAEHGWIPMTTRPKDGQRIVYWFDPFKSVAIGTYHTATKFDGDDLDYVAGKSGFTTVDPECPWWMPMPTDEQRARELALKGVGNG